MIDVYDLTRAGCRAVDPLVFVVVLHDLDHFIDPGRVASDTILDSQSAEETRKVLNVEYH